jgi:pimeloyl-ACP methyl ester carboxylesterase
MACSEHSFTIDDVRARMLRGGQGDTLLFLHGAAGLTGWPAFYEALSQDYDLMVPEHPGFGTSDDSPEIQDMAGLAGYYLRFIEVMGLQRVHLIGSSLGGWLAAELAIRAPQAWRSLTLIGPAGLRPRVGPPPGAPAPTAEDNTRRLFFNQAIPDRMLAQAPTPEQQRLQARNRAAVARLAGNFHNPGLEPALARLQLPGLVVWGAQDRVVPVEQAALWGQALGGAEVCVVPECGHLPHLERPDVAAAQVGRFLAAQGRARPVD